MKKIGLTLFWSVFLLGFCSKNLDLLDQEIAGLDSSLITFTSFVIVFFFLNQSYLCVFYSLHNKFAYFILMKIFFWQKTLNTLIILSDLTWILVLIVFLNLSIKDFLVDSLMCLYISFMAFLSFKFFRKD